VQFYRDQEKLAVEHWQHECNLDKIAAHTQAGR
jgi:hypothetical protein